MKKLHILALSMLLSTSAVIMQAREHSYESEDSYDSEQDRDVKRGLDKKRNDNSYDGRLDDCKEEFAHDENRGVDDEYDKKHNLNKKRNSKTHPICTEVCAEKIETVDHPVCTESCSKTIEIVAQAPVITEANAADRDQLKAEIAELKAEIKEDDTVMNEEVAQVKVQHV